MLIGGTDAEAEAPILWPSETQSWLIRKDSEVGKIEGNKILDDRAWDFWMASPNRQTGLSKLQELVM